MLVASGNVVTEQLNIAVWEDSTDGAIKAAERMVKCLSGAYFSFHLYEVSEQQKLLATFSTETVTTVKTNRK